jgi:fructosamine-3-kinase
VSRRDIYYWKCDRPAAFHGTQARRQPDAEIERQLRAELGAWFGDPVAGLKPAASQGNHLTWHADVAGVAAFIRVENGPERDGHLAVESALIDRVGTTGVRVPRVLGCDASRNRVSFAWQALEAIPWPDLNHWHKRDELDVPAIAFDIGVAVATWQQLGFPGYGPLDAGLRGYHAGYPDYFRLRLDGHLDFLVSGGFMPPQQRRDIAALIERHRDLLQLHAGCFVHKDLALWNILGSANRIAAFIDFDDSISGDPMDDLSLLGCFHDAAFLGRVLEGYQTLRPLPSEHRRRFWLHLLRNMIVKAVIRLGAGYFDRDDGFFLIGAGSRGSDLKHFTHQRLALAMRGLDSHSSLDAL